MADAQALDDGGGQVGVGRARGDVDGVEERARSRDLVDAGIHRGRQGRAWGAVLILEGGAWHGELVD